MRFKLLILTKANCGRFLPVSAQDGGAGAWSGLRAGLAAESCVAAKRALAEPWEGGRDGVSGEEGRGARVGGVTGCFSLEPRIQSFCHAACQGWEDAKRELRDRFAWRLLWNSK